VNSMKSVDISKYSTDGKKVDNFVRIDFANERSENTQTVTVKVIDGKVVIEAYNHLTQEGIIGQIKI